MTQAESGYKTIDPIRFHANSDEYYSRKTADFSPTFDIKLESGCVLCCQVVSARFNSIAGVLVVTLAYCNIVFSPWIYMAQYDVVKRPLANCIKCNKLDNQQPPAAN